MENQEQFLKEIKKLTKANQNLAKAMYQLECKIESIININIGLSDDIVKLRLAMEKLK